MNPFQYEAACEVCGEQGMAHVKHSGADFFGQTFTHNDPTVCAENIRRKLMQDQREPELTDGCGI